MTNDNPDWIRKMREEDVEDDARLYFTLSYLPEKWKLSKRATAQFLIEHWYKQMETDSFRDNQFTPTGSAGMNRGMEEITGDDVAAETDQMQREHPAQFLSVINPMREYDGLTSGHMHVGDALRLEPSEYRSYGAFPRIRMPETIGARIQNRIRQLIAGKDTDDNSDEETDIAKLYQAQQTFLTYEKKFDKVLQKNMVQKLNEMGMTRVYDIYKKMFAEAFRATVDELGGIEKFKEVRERLYRAQEQAEKAGWYTFPARTTVAHFRKINRKKIALYYGN